MNTRWNWTVIAHLSCKWIVAEANEMNCVGTLYKVKLALIK